MFGVTVTIMWESGVPTGPLGNRIWEQQAGWPARSLACLYVIDAGTVVSEGAIDFQPASGAFSRILTPHMIPFGIRSSGFAINTLFYAAIPWLLFQLRRYLRIRRGHCPACGYPAGEASVCSECGRAVNARSSNATAE